jgi:hypothetical protein
MSTTSRQQLGRRVSLRMLRYGNADALVPLCSHDATSARSARPPFAQPAGQTSAGGGAALPSPSRAPIRRDRSEGSALPTAHIGSFDRSPVRRVPSPKARLSKVRGKKSIASRSALRGARHPRRSKTPRWPGMIEISGSVFSATQRVAPAGVGVLLSSSCSSRTGDLARRSSSIASER